MSESQEVTERLDHLESEIIHVKTAVNELTQTVENAMMLFSQSEKGEYVELTERRFQGGEANHTRIESRYRRTQFTIAGLKV